MDNNSLERRLERQIKKVLFLVRERLDKDAEKLMLNSFYKKYNKALKIIEEKGDKNEITIQGGYKVYSDLYTAWMTPLLDEMDKAEQLLNEILGEDLNL